MNSRADRRPNILWISFEDTNPFYGCYGDPVARTPNLDRLAADGCRWTHCFSTAGVCAPARSAVITGMYPISIGTHHMRTTHTNDATPEMPTPYSALVPHYVKCFTEYLRAAGYYCTNNAKTDYQFTPPLTAWDEIGNRAHWRSRPDPDQPFFAVFNPTRTHESGMWPEETRPSRAGLSQGETVLAEFDPAAVELPPYFPDTPKVREAMARMYSNIEHSDLFLGQLLLELEEDGLSDNTVVVHWSDHGPLPRGKRWPYDSGIHVPLIARWPGHIQAGRVSDQLVSTIDLAPTALSLAGVNIPSHMQGQAFLGPRSAPARRYVYASRDRHDEAYDMVRAVRDSRYKYIRNCRPDLPYLLWVPYHNRHPIVEEMWRLYLAGELSGPQLLMFQPRPVEELYDTQTDPHEIDNLAADPTHAEELLRLRAALDGWLSDVGDLGKLDEAQMVRRWYPGGEQPQTAPPLFIPICADSPGRELSPGGGRFEGPLVVQLHSATQGASIAYTLQSGGDARWRLYTEPLGFPPGETTLRAKAVRIGFSDSNESTATFTVGADARAGQK
ncbi:MAG: sulfatase [Gemmatimonadetes bacterium]|nr:sulfatase [Gemmatimonadota bacterium]